MYNFITDNFVKSSHFIAAALKSGTLTLSLSDYKVLSMSGFCEILNIDISSKTKSFPDHYHLNDLIPKEQYQLKRDKLSGFYELSKANQYKNIIISYVIKLPGNNAFAGSDIFVNIRINRDEKIASINIFKSEAAGSINNQIILVSHLTDNGDHHIVYTTHLYKDNGVTLINYEYDILCLLAEGYATEAIAELLSISKFTVNGYRKSLFKKFNAVNTLQLIYNAFEEGYI